MKKNILFVLSMLFLVACDPNDPTQSVLTTNSNFNPKAFSVSDTSVVYFSPGNLQYCPLSHTWRFATNQTDTLGVGNQNISNSYSGWIDLFSWGTGDDPTSTAGKASFSEWGNNHILNGGNHKWFTLSNAEWTYLMTKRQHIPFRALVDGRRGVILLPDDFERPDSVFYEESNNNKKWSLESNRLTLKEWQKMEANGAVFLPLNGWRDGTDVQYEHKRGSYWSRTLDDPGRAYEITMKEEYKSSEKEYRYYINVGNTLDTKYGLGVRLVRKN
jgi:hypothetical protein